MGPSGSAEPPTPGTLAAVAEYEYRALAMPSGTDRQTARSLLTMHAEYGHWELARLRLWPDGRRHVTLRRKIIRQRELEDVGGFVD